MEKRLCHILSTWNFIKLYSVHYRIESIFREGSLTQCQSLLSRRALWSDFRSFWSSFRCRRKTGVPGEKPAEASLDWKPNAHKCRDRESNPGLIGAKRGKIRCANLLPHHMAPLWLFSTSKCIFNQVNSCLSSSLNC